MNWENCALAQLHLRTVPDEFEWQTDVEDVWVEDEPVLARPARKISRRLKVLSVTLFACALIGAATWIYISLNSRVRVATESAHSDVLETHELLANAALRGDTDVVESLTASRPSSWHALQTELLSKRLFFGRRPLAIDPIADAGRHVAEISMDHVSPDLTKAEVRDRRPYIVRNSDGTTETVVLERSFLYQQIDNQWLLSPPADDRTYWGNWEHDEREYLTLTFPRRDEETAIRLAGELDRFLVDLCAENAVACPPSFNLVLRLETDQTSLRRLGELPYPLRASSAATDDRLSLPTPSLIGIPVDEAGFRALQRGYAGWIGAAIVAGYGLQDDSADSDATVAVLADFGLRPPPLPFQPLPRSSLDNFPTGAPTPQQDVLMLCAARSSTRLLRFRADSGRWQEEIPPDQWREVGPLTPQHGTYLSRLPDYSVALIQVEGMLDAENVRYTYVWQDGSFRLMAEETRPYLYLPPSFQDANQPIDRYLVFYVPEIGNNGWPVSDQRLDLNMCESEPCSLEPLAGLPIWSSDGRQTLVYVPQSNGGTDLYLGDDAGEVQVLIGPGQSAIWHDEMSFSYVALEPGAAADWLGRRFGRQVMIADARTQYDPAPLFNAESVRQSIPESIRPESLGLWWARPVAQGEPAWIISTASMDPADGRDFLVILDPWGGEVVIAADLDRFRQFQPPMVSPGGRYAVSAGVAADGTGASVELVDTATGEMRRLDPFIPIDWSADGAWLLSVGGRALHLVSSATGQEWTVAHDLPGCNSAVWTDR
ncbi:MAG: hypothetical protein JSW55_16440 [Chloroflexota bacterium]|nr:MAG: hypothetical protein JSW55_16440 [Chloroflexota bacterium]